MATREEWMRRLGPLYGGAVALVASTPWRWPGEVGREARAPAWVVVVGAPIGVAAWLVAAVAHALGLPASVAALLGLCALTAASAAIVERGLAERLDRDERIGRVGAITVVTLVLFTLVRAAAIAAVPPERWLAALVATAIVGRWAAVFLQALGEPILDDDAPRSLVATSGPAWVVAAVSIGVAVIAVVALGKLGLLVLALVAAGAFALGVDAQRRDRGLSAPVVATAAALGELVVLLAASAS